jgi:hypothetical protein
MDNEEARDIARRLSQRVGTSSEDEWGIWAALMAFPSPPSSYWLPGEGSTLNWVENRALIRATAAPEAKLDYRAQPLVSDDWSFEVSFQSTSLDDAGFQHPGLRSNWSFHLPSGEVLEIEGETLVSRDSSAPNEAEILARDIALSMLKA